MNKQGENSEDFRKKSDKPVLKGAYIEEAVYVGDDQIDFLVAIKSKEELIGDIIGLDSIRKDSEYLDTVESIWKSLRTYVE